MLVRLILNNSIYLFLQCVKTHKVSMLQLAINWYYLFYLSKIIFCVLFEYKVIFVYVKDLIFPAFRYISTLFLVAKNYC